MKKFNLCTTYILPMVGLNRFSFSQNTNNLVNSYVTEDNQYVVVELTTYATSLVTNQINYKFSFTKNGNTFAVFKIPDEFKEDVVKFREGKYSKFNEKTKQVIKKKSGLKNQAISAGGLVESHPALLVLDKAEELRKQLEEDLDVKISADAELGEIPGEENFYVLELTEV